MTTLESLETSVSPELDHAAMSFIRRYNQVHYEAAKCRIQGRIQIGNNKT
ncbi:hypothetical protein M5X00_12860 [Paenibacillus alvei]|nr:hypothetical protein [Paenibacillus alvei]MCY9703901.1 hypothetical protein [Paenibacillus alvei]MCY9755130.1 hypothetical protein [Paenibacillus alvei]